MKPDSRSIILINIPLIALFVVGSTCEGATITVDPGGAGDFTEIQPAIDAAEDGDTVLVKPGEYVITEPIDFNRLHDPEDPGSPAVKDIILRSAQGADVTTIRMADEPTDEGRGSVVVFENSETQASVLEGFTLTGGTGIAGEYWSSGGGGVSCGGSSPILTNCTITQNWANFGSGVFCVWGSSPTLTNCTISENSGGEGGGGVWCDEESSPIVTNCTISGNDGGGVISSFASATLTNCTIWGNAVGVSGYCGSATLTNCIVWNNAGGSIGTVALETQVSYSCIDTPDVFPGEGNINDDPIFLQPGHWNDNGTPGDPDDDTWVEGDYHLPPGSPCIDTGTADGAPTFDIEGNLRSCGGGFDMGAYEFGDCWPSTRFLRGDVDANGNLEVTDVINFLNYQFVGSATLDCLDAADVDDSGVLELTDAIRSLNYQFTGTAEPPEPPGPFTCGPDPTNDELGCGAFPPCQPLYLVTLDNCEGYCAKTYVGDALKGCIAECLWWRNMTCQYNISEQNSEEAALESALESTTSDGRTVLQMHVDEVAADPSSFSAHRGSPRPDCLSSF